MSDGEALVARLLDERWELKAEIDRLRAESQENYDLWQRAEAWGNERHDEVERLRAVVRDLHFDVYGREVCDPGWRCGVCSGEVNHSASD